LNGKLLVWWIYPDRSGFLRWFRGFVDEALRVCLEGVVQSVLTGGMNCVSLPVVHLVWRHEADADLGKRLLMATLPGECLSSWLGAWKTPSECLL
jgi:hypothetical protein